MAIDSLDAVFDKADDEDHSLPETEPDAEALEADAEVEDEQADATPEGAGSEPDAEAAPPAAVEKDRRKSGLMLAVMDELEKLQEARREADNAKRERDELKARLAGFERQSADRERQAAEQVQRQRQEAVQADPMARTMEMAAFEARRQVSQYVAEEKFGANVIQEAMALIQPRDARSRCIGRLRALAFPSDYVRDYPFGEDDYGFRIVAVTAPVGGVTWDSTDITWDMT